jgi:hypothetical protein
VAYKHHTDPELRRALEKWLAAESEGMENRLEAVRVAAEVARLVGEVLDQRGMEARAYNRSWSAIAEAVGITRQSAHKRWRHLEPRARALAEAEEARFRSSRRPPNAPWTRTEP